MRTDVREDGVEEASTINARTRRREPRGTPGQLRLSRLRLQIRVEIQVEVEERLLLVRPEVWSVRVRAEVRRVLDGG